MNNVMFGKTMDNLRKHNNIMFASTDKCKKLFTIRSKSPLYKIIV